MKFILNKKGVSGIVAVLIAVLFVTCSLSEAKRENEKEIKHYQQLGSQIDECYNGGGRICYQNDCSEAETFQFPFSNCPLGNDSSGSMKLICCPEMCNSMKEILAANENI